MMCAWGSTVRVRVLVPAYLSSDGRKQWKAKSAAVDECIAPIVKALNVGGIATLDSCCGHGQRDGEILLEDGRTLVVRAAEGGGDE